MIIASFGVILSVHVLNTMVSDSVRQGPFSFDLQVLPIRAFDSTEAWAGCSSPPSQLTPPECVLLSWLPNIVVGLGGGFTRDIGHNLRSAFSLRQNTWSLTVFF